MDDVRQTTSAFYEDDIVTITLETSSLTFKVSKLLLYRASDFFRKALEGKFAEAGSKTLRLPGYQEDEVGVLLFWLYNNSLPDFGARAKLLEKTDGVEPKTQFIRQTHRLMVSLWQFGDQHVMPKLQNEAMRRLLELMSSHWLRPDCIKHCFEVSAEDSLLRAALTKEAVFDWKAGHYAGNGSMDELAAISGFYEVFCTMLAKCPEDCVHEPYCRPSLKANWKQYMVKEG